MFTKLHQLLYSLIQILYKLDIQLLPKQDSLKYFLILNISSMEKTKNKYLLDLKFETKIKLVARVSSFFFFLILKLNIMNGMVLIIIKGDCRFFSIFYSLIEKLKGNFLFKSFGYIIKLRFFFI